MTRLPSRETGLDSLIAPCPDISPDSRSPRMLALAAVSTSMIPAAVEAMATVKNAFASSIGSTFGKMCRISTWSFTPSSSDASRYGRPRSSSVAARVSQGMHRRGPVHQHPGCGAGPPPVLGCDACCLAGSSGRGLQGDRGADRAVGRGGRVIGGTGHDELSRPPSPARTARPSSNGPACGWDVCYTCATYGTP
jgi:hypothetical protein